MRYRNVRLLLPAGSSVEVNCDLPANVMLIDDLNFYNYLSGGQFQYWGQRFDQFPARVYTPHYGYWNLVVDTRDMGDYPVNATYKEERHVG